MPATTSHLLATGRRMRDVFQLFLAETFIKLPTAGSVSPSNQTISFDKLSENLK